MMLYTGYHYLLSFPPQKEDKQRKRLTKLGVAQAEIDEVRCASGLYLLITILGC